MPFDCQETMRDDDKELGAWLWDAQFISAHNRNFKNPEFLKNWVNLAKINVLLVYIDNTKRIEYLVIAKRNRPTSCERDNFSVDAFNKIQFGSSHRN